MFIIEGADNLGKTTAAKRIVELANARKRYPIRYQHMGRPPETFDFYLHYKDMISTFAVQDRFHIGGILWHDAIPQDRLRDIERWIRSAGSYTVAFITTDEEWYRKRLSDNEGREMFSVNTIFAANKRMKDLTWNATYPEKEPYVGVDEVFNVSELGGFPTDEHINRWIDRWFVRIETKILNDIP